MDALDGNAIAGDLFEIFGREMTTTTGVCAACGTTARLAELSVYVRAPGTVVRRRNCSSVGLVLLTIHGVPRVHAVGFELHGAEQP